MSSITWSTIRLTRNIGMSRRLSTRRLSAPDALTQSMNLLRKPSKALGCDDDDENENDPEEQRPAVLEPESR